MKYLDLVELAKEKEEYAKRQVSSQELKIRQKRGQYSLQIEIISYPYLTMLQAAP